jgi:glycosyltransferase involved in cell wall biosynthesis
MNGVTAEVTVVIPTHDRWPFLSTLALPSALGQKGVQHEVIVVDDGSSDETPARLVEIEDPRLRVVRHERPLGKSAARNAGIAAARGKWIAFLDDDDAWAPNKLRAQLDAAQAAGASFVYSGAIVVREGDCIMYGTPTPEPEELGSRLRAHSSIPGGCSNVMARTELVRRLGGFDEGLAMLQDWDLWLRLAQAAKSARCPEVLVACTAHSSNTYVRSAWPDMSRALEYFLDKHRGELDVDVGRFVRWVAIERRQRGRRIGPALLLFATALRFRRPRYALQALGFLAPWRKAPSWDSGETVQKPDWLVAHRATFRLDQR